MFSTQKRLADGTTYEHTRNLFSRSYENRSSSFVRSFVRSFSRSFIRSFAHSPVIQFIVSHLFVCLLPLSFVFLIHFICFVTIYVDVTIPTFSFCSWLAVVIQKKAGVTEGIPKATLNIQRNKTKWNIQNYEVIPFLTFERISFSMLSLNFASASLMRSFVVSFLYAPTISASSAWNEKNLLITLFINKSKRMSFV